MSRCLVVNADDFGRSAGINRGIVQAHLTGIVTSTTVMANLPGAVEAAVEAASQAPKLAFGVHLNLTHGQAVLPPAAIPSLVDSAGRFRTLPELCAHINDTDADDVRHEWEAQIETLTGAGLRIDHLDSHHFAAELTPDWWQIYIDLARQHGLGARGPRPPKVGHQQIIPPAPPTPGVAFGAARQALIAAGVPTSDGLRVDFFGDDANQDLLLSLVKGLPEGVTELMTHPGYVDEELLATSDYAKERQIELSVLTSDTTRRAVDEGGVRLARYAEALMG